jgi:hypothetical protein
MMSAQDICILVYNPVIQKITYYSKFCSDYFDNLPRMSNDLTYSRKDALEMTRAEADQIAFKSKSFVVYTIEEAVILEVMGS